MSRRPGVMTEGEQLMEWWAWLIVVIVVVAMLAIAVLAVQSRRRKGGVIVESFSPDERNHRP